MSMRPIPVLTIGPWVLLALSGCASTPQGSIDWGRRLAQNNCARCHAIGARGGSPNAFAPVFRNLSKTRSLASIEDIFAGRGIVAHPPMPDFAYQPDDRQDLLNYIKSIQTAPAKP
jgi:mono/diheme cytochrome c family protein